jgi:hypothetical protein
VNTTLEARLSSERHPVPYPLATHPSSARLTVSRSSLADRLALRLGLALVIWGRRHIERTPDRVEVRDRAVAGFIAELARRERELEARRRLLLELPRR